jgi:uncharacterized membrane protein
MAKVTLRLWMVGLTVLVALVSASYAQKITSFDPPGASFTEAFAINSEGQIVGFYVDAAGVHGFLRHNNGTFTSFDPSGSFGTSAQAINSSGQIAGYYSDTAGTHGFLRQKNGTITSFDPTGSVATLSQSINSDGQITGYYVDANSVTHGFVRSPCEPDDGRCE